MEWATQGEELAPTGESGAYEAPPTTFEPLPTLTQPTVPMAPVSAPVAPAPSSLAAGTGEQCQGCGAHVAADQRYCLHCGQRRGDPRLPFMDASAFMETSMQRRRPPPPPPSPSRKSRMSPNASLIAGVGTLLLAMGIGVLIGRSGDHSGSTAATPPVQVVKVGGAGAATGAAAKTASTGVGSSKATKIKASSSNNANAQTAGSILKPKAGIKLPPAKVQLGQPGHGAGYKNGKFTGQFFGP